MIQVVTEMRSLALLELSDRMAETCLSYESCGQQAFSRVNIASWIGSVVCRSGFDVILESGQNERPRGMLTYLFTLI